MIASIIAIHESQISLSIWQGWLYKRFFLREHLTMGIAELRIGRTNPDVRKHISDQINYFVLEGCGQFISGGLSERFEAGHSFTVSSRHTYELNLDEPTRLLCVNALAAYPPNIMLCEMDSGDRELFRPVRTANAERRNQCHYVVSGTCHVNIKGIWHEQRAGTAFYIAPDIEYTLENHQMQPIRVINAYAGTAARNAQPHFIPT